MRKEKYREIPYWLKHKPVYVIEDYDKVDGHYKGQTDVIGLSLGLSQWDNNVPSVKVWRDVYNDKTKTYRISRESEETTLTRALDLVTFILRVYDSIANNKELEKTITSTVFGKLEIKQVDFNENLEKLKEYLSEDMLQEIKQHILLLKDTIEKINLEKK